MAAGGFFRTQVDAWITQLLTQDLWLGAVTDDPRAVSDPFSVEMPGGAYHRDQAPYINGGGSIVVNGTIVFVGIPAGTPCAGVILTDTEVGDGTAIACALLDTPHITDDSGVWVIDPDQIVFGIDLATP
jgi:hypothetical protein